MSAIDAYLQSVTEPQRVELEKIRRIVHDIIPAIEETISYGMPTFKFKKKAVLHMAAFNDHLSLFPTGDSLPEEIEDKITKFRTGKGTLQFSETNPIPELAIQEIVTYRMQSIESHR